MTIPTLATVSLQRQSSIQFCAHYGRTISPPDAHELDRHVAAERGLEARSESQVGRLARRVEPVRERDLLFIVPRKEAHLCMRARPFSTSSPAIPKNRLKIRVYGMYVPCRASQQARGRCMRHERSLIRPKGEHVRQRGGSQEIGTELGGYRTSRLCPRCSSSA